MEKWLTEFDSDCLFFMNVGCGVCVLPLSFKFMALCHSIQSIKLHSFVLVYLTVAGLSIIEPCGRVECVGLDDSSLVFRLCWPVVTKQEQRCQIHLNSEPMPPDLHRFQPVFLYSSCGNFGRISAELPPHLLILFGFIFVKYLP